MYLDGTKKPIKGVRGMYEKGCWVQSKLDNSIGFVEGENQFGAIVNWFVDGRLVKANASGHKLIKLGSKLNSEDLNVLIEMSLATGDKEWFTSLMTQLEQAKERGVAE